MSQESIVGKDATSSLDKLPGLFRRSLKRGEEKLASLMCIYICFLPYGIGFDSPLLFKFFYSTCGDSSSDCSCSTNTALLLTRRKSTVSAIYKQAYWTLKTTT